MFRTMLASCAVALMAGSIFMSPSDAKAEFSISVGDYGGSYSHSYRDSGEHDYSDRSYRGRHHHVDDDHDHDCRWIYSRVPAYHWHDGHYGQHGYKERRVWVCDSD